MFDFLKAISIGLNSIAQRITPEGGTAVWLVNKTGAPSVRGMIVRASTVVDGAFSIPVVDSNMPIGIVYDSGIPDGQPCRVVVGGIADVLLTDGTASTCGNWVRTGDALGSEGTARADLAGPPGGGVNVHEAHMAEIGHSLQTVGAGVGVLCRCLIHFN
jgi:hypothetical protein